ncbi:MAG: GNAT family N-acetyltransferase [Alphaproteobacteria bacterium]|nr:GNAT family N-acetyltransferase [Alphaproteobacteria bacterium]
MSAVAIARARTPEDVAACKALFQEYAASLAFSLCFQNFDREMAEFPGAYGAPDGALLLAKVDGKPMGAVGLWSLGDGIAEMKRLYVRPAARGLKLGRNLAEALIVEAVALGYRVMRLDTLETMTRAIPLYRSLGFVNIAPYTFNPIAGAQYFELDLGTHKPRAATP